MPGGPALIIVGADLYASDEPAALFLLSGSVIVACPALPCPVLSCLVLSCPVLSCSVCSVFFPVLSYSFLVFIVVSCSVLFSLDLYCLVLFSSVLSCSTLPCHVLYSSPLFFPVLGCSALFFLVLSREEEKKFQGRNQRTYFELREREKIRSNIFGLKVGHKKTKRVREREKAESILFLRVQCKSEKKPELVAGVRK